MSKPSRESAPTNLFLARSDRGLPQNPVLAGIAVALLAFTGCADDAHRVIAPPSATPGPPAGSFPVFRDEAAWSRSGHIAYRDNGIVSVSKYGSYQVDTSRVGIWIVDPATGSTHRLLPWGNLPAWSPNGEDIAFFRNGQLFRIKRDGSGLKQLTSSGGYFPSWHPSGRALAYDSNAHSPTGSNTIWVMDEEGVNRRALCPPQPGERRMPSWSPAGGQLACIWYPGGDIIASEVYLVDSSFCDVTRLTFLNGIVECPRFSPDGTLIAFVLQKLSDPLPQVWLMNSDGTELRQVTANGGMRPAWSPDGNELVYTNAEWRYSGTGQGELWIINILTGGERLLTSHVTPAAALPSRSNRPFNEAVSQSQRRIPWAILNGG